MYIYSINVRACILYMFVFVYVYLFVGRLKVRHYNVNGAMVSQRMDVRRKMYIQWYTTAVLYNDADSRDGNSNSPACGEREKHLMKFNIFLDGKGSI